MLPFSAATQASLDARLEDFAQFNFGGADILDLAHTLGSRRSNLPTRGFLIAPRGNFIRHTISTQPLTTSSGIADGSVPLAFVFTGQGSQWAGMCRELFSEFPVFREAIAEMDTVLQNIPHGPTWSLQQAILDTENAQLIHQPESSQPCCTAIQVALLELLNSWEIRPAATVGHSSGEIAAAFAAGHLSAAEAIIIAYYRGYCAARNTQQGAMIAAGVSESTVAEEIREQKLDLQLRVACVSSPQGVTVSGDVHAVDQLLQVLEKKGVFARKLKTGGQAYHSHHMLAVSDKYHRMLIEVLPTLSESVRLPQGATMVSSVTGRPKVSGFNASYWRSNLEGQVKFAAAIDAIHQGGAHHYVEIGPHSSLELPIKQTVATAKTGGDNFRYTSAIKRNTNALETVLSLPAQLWLHGYATDWSNVNGLHRPGKTSSTAPFRVLTDLPPYRFDYPPMLWNECRASIEYRQRKYPRHELLGSLVPGGNGDDLVFRNLLDVGYIAWLQDHKLEQTVVFPGAGYIGMAMEGVMQATNTDRASTQGLTFRFEDLNIVNALVLGTERGDRTELFSVLRRSPITNASSSAMWWDFRISSYDSGYRSCTRVALSRWIRTRTTWAPNTWFQADFSKRLRSEHGTIGWSNQVSTLDRSFRRLPNSKLLASTLMHSRMQRHRSCALAATSCRCTLSILLRWMR